MSNQYQYGSPENKFWEEEKISRAEILNEIKRKYGKKSRKNLDVDTEKEDKEPHHPNAVYFIFATREKYLRETWRKKMEMMGFFRIRLLRPKKLRSQNNIQFKTGKLSTNKPQDDCDY